MYADIENPQLVEALTGLLQAAEGLAYLLMIGVVLIAFLWLTRP